MGNGRFFLRLLAPTALLLAVIAALLVWEVYYTAQHAGAEHVRGDLGQLTDAVRERLPTPLDEPSARTVLRNAAGYAGVQAALLSADRHWVEGPTIGSRAALFDRHEVRQALAGADGFVVEDEPAGGRLGHLAVALRPGGPWVLRLSRTIPPRGTMGAPLVMALVGAAVGSVLLMTLLAVRLNRQWFSPVRRLTDMSQRLAAGDWQVRNEPAGDARVRLLARWLNQAATAAQNQMAELRRQRRDLQVLMDCLPDPVILCDAEKRISVINAPAAELLRVARHEAIGQKLLSVVPDRAIVEILEGEHARRFKGESPEAEHAAERSELRVSRDGHRLTYQAIASGMADGGVLLVLRDMTEVVGAATMKTDFVANASHELRTPIAAIKIAFETLREVYGEDRAQTERCMAVIAGHVRRLEEMIRDLLDLSRVENPELPGRLGAVRSGDLLASVRSALAAMAREKDVKLLLEEPGGSISFQSDERMLHLIVKNLAENSIKFTPAGGTVRVSVGLDTAAADGGQVLLTVADTGIGIPPEHVERVFERFYQVDPARSSASGRGTGLGLAIVKHATAALGGRVELTSKVGEGTTATCRIPYVHSQADFTRIQTP